MYNFPVFLRATKRPARYTYSSEEDELINEETPKKKGNTGIMPFALGPEASVMWS